MTLVFPTRLFAPPSLRARVAGAATSGGRSLGGIAPLGEFSGGGLWTIEFGEVNLNERDKFMSWRALEAALDNGASSVIVPLGDRRNQPIARVAPALQAFSDDTLWDDSASWTPLEVDAVVSTDAALRATQISFTYADGSALVGGEHFSILHATKGWRMYNVIRVLESGGSPDATTVQIRPPLRAAVAAGMPLNFDSPRCLCRIDGEAAAMLDMLRFGRGGPARFVETFPANIGA